MTTKKTTEGFTYDRSDEAVLVEPVKKFNELVIYLDSISECL